MNNDVRGWFVMETFSKMFGPNEEVTVRSWSASLISGSVPEKDRMSEAEARAEAERRNLALQVMEG